MLGQVPAMETRTQTIQRPKTVMEEQEVTVQEPRTVMETKQIQVICALRVPHAQSAVQTAHLRYVHCLHAHTAGPP